MQTLDAFLEQDIPLFLDGFEHSAEGNRAGVDEISDLLTHSYHKSVHSALQEGTIHHVNQPISMVKTVNIFQTVSPQQAQEQVAQEQSDQGQDSIQKEAQEDLGLSSEQSSDSSADSSLNKEAGDVSQNISGVENDQSPDNQSVPLDDVNVNSSSQETSEHDSALKSSKDIVGDVDGARKEIDGSTLEHLLGNNLDEDMVFYVQALKEIEQKNKTEAVSILYSLAKKYPKNLGIRTRLQDALILPGDIIHIPSISVPVAKTSFVDNDVSDQSRIGQSAKSVLVKDKDLDEDSSKDSVDDPLVKKPLLSKEQLALMPKIEEYVLGMQAIADKDKERAIMIFTELIKQKPNNLALKLRLQEAMKL